MIGGSHPAGALAAIRSEWLDRALPQLVGDPRVVGLAFVGSLGRGEADDWSDVDLFVVVDDEQIASFVDRQSNPLWAAADLLVDARHNSPAGAMSVGTVYVRSGLPLGVDWYVYPSSIAALPSDCRVVHETTALPPVDATFAEFNSTGPRQTATPKTADEVRQATLAMAPIAGKYIARRSPAATAMIQFLGGTTRAVGATPTEQLQALRAIAARLSTAANPHLEYAVELYLEVVESTIP